MSYIMAMSPENFIDFLEVAIEKDEADRIHAEYCAVIPFMARKEMKYQNFKEYLDMRLGKNIDYRSNDEIIRDIEETHRKAKEQTNGNI